MFGGTVLLPHPLLSIFIRYSFSNLLWNFTRNEHQIRGNVLKHVQEINISFLLSFSQPSVENREGVKC